MYRNRFVTYEKKYEYVQQVTSEDLTLAMLDLKSTTDNLLNNELYNPHKTEYSWKLQSLVGDFSTTRCHCV